MAVDTFGGRIHVEWHPGAAITPLGQLPFFNPRQRWYRILSRALGKYLQGRRLQPPEPLPAPAWRNSDDPLSRMHASDLAQATADGLNWSI